MKGPLVSCVFSRGWYVLVNSLRASVLGTLSEAVCGLPCCKHSRINTLCYVPSQALRFEVVDLSRLARFLISRATNNPAFATFLHWYVFTEWEDPSFGPRASAVHAAFVNALTSALRGEAVWEAIRRQTDMVSQLAYIIKEVKVSVCCMLGSTEGRHTILG